MAKNDRANFSSKLGVILASAGSAVGLDWRWVGRMGVLTGFLILSYYSVVAGWTLEYITEAVTNSFSGKTPDEFISSFQQFSSNPWRPLLWLVVFLLITHFIIVKGVEKGIEKSSKIMLPLGGLCISVFTGWYLDKKIVWSEITNDGSLKVPVYKLIIFILKYIAPIAISLIFINELGLIKL